MSQGVAMLLSGLQAALSREWIARKTLLLAVVATAVPLVLLPDGQRDAWALFELALLAPLIAIGLAAAGDPRSDATWAGLGGRPVDRLAGRLLLHSLLIGVAVIGPWYTLMGAAGAFAFLADEAGLEGLILAALLGGNLSLYLAATLSRRHAGGLGLLGGPLVVAAVVGAGGAIDWETGGWSVLEGHTLRVVLLSVGALAVLLGREGHLRRRSDQTRALVGALLLGGLSLLPGAVWDGRPLFVPPLGADADPVARRMLWTPQQAAIFASRRALLWHDGSWSLVGPAGAVDGRLGRDGAVTLLVRDGTADVLFLQTDAGTTTTCPLGDRTADRSAWERHDDGTVGIGLTGAEPRMLLTATPTGACVLAPKARTADDAAWSGPFVAEAGSPTLLGPAR